MPHAAAKQKRTRNVRNARSFATRTAPVRAAHPAKTTTRRDGCLRRSRNNRPPRSPDAELDFAGTTALWTPPRWRCRSRLKAFRDGGVRTKGQAAASSPQARAKRSTAYWYEPNASGAPSNTNAVIVYCQAAWFQLLFRSSCNVITFHRSWPEENCPAKFRADP